LTQGADLSLRLCQVPAKIAAYSKTKNKGRAAVLMRAEKRFARAPDGENG